MRALIALALLASPASALTLKSADFTDGGMIPAAQVLQRCNGQNVSPELTWSGAPAGTKSFVLTMIDRDVPPNGWSHWVITDIPASTHAIARGAGGLPSPAKGVGSNMGSNRYAGPCPRPAPEVHHYRVTLYAMPAPTTAIAPNEKAEALDVRLRRTALATGAITGAVNRIH